MLCSVGIVEVEQDAGDFSFFGGFFGSSALRHLVIEGDVSVFVREKVDDQLLLVCRTRRKQKDKAQHPR